MCAISFFFHRDGGDALHHCENDHLKSRKKIPKIPSEERDYEEVEEKNI